MTTQSMTPFDFNGNNIRVITDEHGEPWFVARDICISLGLDPNQTTNNLLRLPEKNVITITNRANGLRNGTKLINEQGLYRLLLSSRAPKAEPFVEWVTGEVLPTIRKAGEYRTPGREFRQTAQGLLPVQVAAITLDSLLHLSKALGVPTHIAQVEAVKAVDHDTGIDLRPMLKHAPAQSGLAADDEWLEPTELAKRVEEVASIPISAKAMNRLLESWGMQVRSYDRTWQVTAAGETIAKKHQWTKGSKRGYNLLWHVPSVLQLANQFMSVKERKDV